MRLWHYKLIPCLPRQQFVSQHREICALLGKGWKKPHSIVDYIYKYGKESLKAYHYRVFKEADHRGYKFKRFKETYDIINKYYSARYIGEYLYQLRYLEHTKEYLSICLHNLKYAISPSTEKSKNIDLFSHFPDIKDYGHYEKEYEIQYLGNYSELVSYRA